MFVQFLDCVWQLTLQFPVAFAFNEALLLFLARELSACRYGTFLGDNAREREERGIRASTASVWEDVLEPRNAALWANARYAGSGGGGDGADDDVAAASGGDAALWPSVSAKHVRVWEGHFAQNDYGAVPAMAVGRDAAAATGATAPLGGGGGAGGGGAAAAGGEEPSVAEVARCAAEAKEDSDDVGDAASPAAKERSFAGEFSFIYRYIVRESCSQFDAPPNIFDARSQRRSSSDGAHCACRSAPRPRREGGATRRRPPQRPTGMTSKAGFSSARNKARGSRGTSRREART